MRDDVNRRRYTLIAALAAIAVVAVLSMYGSWIRNLRRTVPTSAVLSDAGYFAKRVTLSLALRSSGDAGRGVGR
ncbi:MAG: hypothetical protein WA711_22490, partial [Pseudolabrys sp.]